MTHSFYDYMPMSQEFANPTNLRMDLSEDHPGWVINYISHSFLDGWINYVQPILAFVVCSYRSYEETSEKVEQWRKDPPVHTCFSTFGDDTLLLCRGHAGEYWFFWYDMDVSDCTIGRFQTSDPESGVKELFRKFVEDRAKRTASAMTRSHNDPFEIDVSKLKGWLAF